MDEQTITAESSPAQQVETVEVERGPLVTLTPDQRTEFRRTGELPAKPKADPAPAKTEKPEAEASASKSGEAAKAKESETAPESEAGKTQQEHHKAKPTAEERIAQLEATIEKIRKGAGLEKAQPKVEPPPTREQPKPEYTRPKPTIEDKNEKGEAKYTSYEDFVEALSDWKTEQRIVANERERAQAEQAKRIADKLSEARSRYQNFDEAVKPAVQKIMSDPAVSPVVKYMMDESEVLPDLLFTIGSKQEELDSFLEMAKTNPGGAIRYIALTESLIREELEAGKVKEKPKAEPKDPPAKKETSAPKPPSEVGGRGAAPADALESAVAAGDYRTAKREMTQRALARLKK